MIEPVIGNARTTALIGEWPGALFITLLWLLVALQVEDCLQDAAYKVEDAIRVRAIPGAAVVTVLKTAPKTFAEVVAVLRQVNIVTIVAICRVLISVRILVVETPPVLSIRLTGAHAFLIAEVQGPPKHIGTVLIRLIVSTAAIVAVAVRRIGELPMALQAELVLTQPLQIELLKSELVHATLLLQQAFPLRSYTLVLLEATIVFGKPLLVTPLLLHLLLLRQALLLLLLLLF